MCVFVGGVGYAWGEHAKILDGKEDLCERTWRRREARQRSDMSTRDWRWSLAVAVAVAVSLCFRFVGQSGYAMRPMIDRMMDNLRFFGSIVPSSSAASALIVDLHPPDLV